jgi:phospholipid/cholesterol/gamma-HCH transport system permease protein
MDAKSFTNYDSKTQHLTCCEDWNLINFTHIKKQLNKFKWPSGGEIMVDGGAVASMDSAGAFLLTQFKTKAEKKGVKIRLEQFPEATMHLIDLVEKSAVPLSKIPSRNIPNWLAKIGQYNWEQILQFRDYVNFAGMLALEFARLIFQPLRWRWNALAHVIDTTGYKALPIIALLSFMIGVVMCYQMGNLLRMYGANIFIVNLLGLSILREFGPLITAIMVAGRTGSAFTAELGIMKINQEVDALTTMGVTPAGLLLLPRIMGLVISLPLLTMWANIFGILGGMVMAQSMLDITFYDFIHRFQHEIPVRNLVIGLGKAPVFALIIASVGCFQGMQVKGSAESVGKLTTRSVVLSIFFIIVADAAFSIIFSRMDL